MSERVPPAGASDEAGAEALARALLEEHGAEAPIVAARCISDRLRDGDQAALAAWRRVLKAIYALQAG